MIQRCAAYTLEDGKQAMVKDGNSQESDSNLISVKLTDVDGVAVRVDVADAEAVVW